MQRTKVAILGAGFITDIHMESYHRFIPEAEVVAVYARNADKAKAFAEKHHIPQWFDDIDEIIQNSGCEQERRGALRSRRLDRRPVEESGPGTGPSGSQLSAVHDRAADIRE